MVIFQQVAVIPNLQLPWLSLYLVLASLNSSDTGVISRLSVDQGLSQSVVRTIHQDRNGFLWFGTWDGLNRFDGHHFTVYRHKPFDPASLSDGRVEVIHQDVRGQLWVGTRHGLNRFVPETGSFVRYLFDPADPHSLSYDVITDVEDAGDGKLWVATSDGLNLLDTETGQARRFHHDPSNPHSLATDSIRDLESGLPGELWVGSHRGLDRLDTRTGRVRRADLTSPDCPDDIGVAALLWENRRTLWIGSGYCLLRLDPLSGELSAFGHHSDDMGGLSPGSPILDLLRSRSGNLWIATLGGGVDVLSPDGRRFQRLRRDQHDPSSLSGDFVTSLFQDDSGVVWIATHGASLSRVVREQPMFEVLPRPRPGHGGPIVRAVLEDAGGRLWMGTDHGLDLVDGGRTVAYLEHENVQALSETPSGLILAGVADSVFLVDPVQGVVERVAAESRSGQVQAVYPDAFGTIWVGTSRGLFHFSQSDGFLTPYEALPRDLGTVNVIRQDPSDSRRLWLGTERGLVRMDGAGGELRIYRHRPEQVEGLSHSHITALRFDRWGDLWIGTYGGGLNRLSRISGRIRHFDERHGLANPLIYAIEADDAENLWVSTNGGLARLDPRTERVTSYDVKDGLPTNEFNAGASATGRGDRIYFGSIKGLAVVAAGRPSPDEYSPPVALTSVQWNGEPLPPDPEGAFSEIELPHGLGVLSLEFAALDYRSAESCYYAYRLEGLNEEWIPLGNQRRLTLTHLSPGKHRLLIRGTNSKGVWSRHQVSLSIHIVIPWWTRWQVWLSAGLLCLFFSAGAYRLWARKTTQHHSALLKEREKRKQVQEALLREITGQVEASEDGPVIAWWLRRTRSILQEEFRQPPSISELAEMAGVHPDYLARRFRQQFGLRINQYVERLRLEWARQQLLEREEQIVAIAVEAGFADQSHFTRRFKKRFGLTPGLYRRVRGRVSSSPTEGEV